MQVCELLTHGQFPSRGWRGNPRRELDRRREVFNLILGVGRKTVKDFYEGRPLDPQRIWDGFFPLSEELYLFSYPGSGEQNRFLNGHATELYSFAERIARDKEAGSSDQIVLVAGGGVEPALICAEALGIEGVSPITFLRYRFGDNRPCLPFWDFDKGKLEEVERKSVLLVDDAIKFGRTFSEVEEVLKQSGAAKIVKRFVVQA
jgi:hypothetical protein